MGDPNGRYCSVHPSESVYPRTVRWGTMLQVWLTYQVCGVDDKALDKKALIKLNNSIVKIGVDARSPEKKRERETFKPLYTPSPFPLPPARPRPPPIIRSVERGTWYSQNLAKFDALWKYLRFLTRITMRERKEELAIIPLSSLSTPPLHPPSPNLPPSRPNCSFNNSPLILPPTKEYPEKGWN